MKKGFLFFFVPLLLLSGCGGPGNAPRRQDTAEPYALQDGRYMCSGMTDKLTPYLLIHEGHYTVVKDTAVSYQPGGTVRREGNAVTLAGKYANEDYCYAFTLIGNDKLRFELGRSKIPQSQSEWKDGMVFSRAEDTEAADQTSLNGEQTELLERYPEYFGLDPSKGLDVIVWQMSPAGYSFGLLEHADTERNWISAELLNLKGVSAAQLREILAAYAVSEDQVYIIPWQNPVSSYLPEYSINVGGEDLAAKKEAYIAKIRGLLFG